MGAYYEEQEKAIEELQALSDEAKRYISHHFRNSLTIILGAIATGNLDIVEEAVRHIVKDLEEIGC